MTDDKVDVFLPLFVADYLADTTDLTTEEHGAYLLLLMAMWRHGGELANDPRRLARVAGVDFARWPDIWRAIGRFFEVGTAAITQRRLARELAHARDQKAAASDRGRRSAAARWGARNPAADATAMHTQCDRNATAYPHAMPDECSPPPPKDPDSGARARSDTPVVPPTAPSPPSPAPPERWPAYRWFSEFARRWAERYQRATYGNGAADAKAIGALADTLADLPDAERAAAETRAAAMIGEFLTDESPRVVKARHPFAFFVTSWNGLRVPARAGPSPPAAAPTDTRCVWHRRPRSANKRARFPSNTCAECKHVEALHRERGDVEIEPESIGEQLRKWQAAPAWPKEGSNDPSR